MDEKGMFAWLMGKIVTLLIVLLYLFFLNKLVIIMIKGDPGIITGFKWGDTEAERNKRKKLVRLLCRSINRGNYITLLGCLFSIVLGSDIGYICFLSFSIFITFPIIVKLLLPTKTKKQ